MNTERIDTERIIDFTQRKLKKLDNAGKVAVWARDHVSEVNSFEQGFNDLISAFNAYNDVFDLDIMHRTNCLKRLLNGVPIPFTTKMSYWDFKRGIRDAYGPMIYGQNIHNGNHSDLNSEDELYAIGTPSMDTTDEALVVGTMGHLIERTFFQWAKRHGIEPKGGWEKDMFLQALGEILLLELTQEKVPVLYRFFVKPNNEGGLGWISPEQIKEFNRRLSQLSPQMQT